MARMDSLSLELIELIVLELLELLDFDTPHDKSINPSLAPYARINRKFHAAVERNLYRRVETSSRHPERLQAINAYALRKAALQELSYVIELPEYDPNREYALERRKEHRANQAAFRDGLVRIWNELSAWEKLPSLSLDLSASSKCDGGDWGFPDRWLCPEHSLSVGDDVELPTVQCVQDLAVARDGRRIHPATIESMVLSLPNLRVLSLGMRAVQFRFQDLRAEYTATLARMLEAPTLGKLEVLNLSLWAHPPTNHDFNTGLQPDPSYPAGDVLSNAIRKLAQRSLRQLELQDNVPISPALFGPPEDDTPFPHLEYIDIQFPILTYDGRWYYTGDRHAVEPDTPFETEVEQIHNGSSLDDGPSDTDSVISLNNSRADFLNGNIPAHEWRTSPDPCMFDPLVHSVAAAALHMPKLRNLLLTTLYEYAFSDHAEEREQRCAVKINYATPECYFGSLRYPNMGLDGHTRCRWVVSLGTGVSWDVPEDIRGIMREKVGDAGDVVVYRSRS
ncbi:uncharacterized protein DSM5745_00710 [Aspergillus mulundensis]|uniref:F-box domain-containing protein n=1 Tax=Aspergillus mulundensis TaxID=1810919 RepID=A0A3D8T5U7_9EURO|nr:Uncharacterized protein DSM5745_00710 [Aspergillus mulundensis]RDW93388.1 Uncharacterized protein DSM5745_00710 [Aspergillus mulundensis]